MPALALCLVTDWYYSYMLKATQQGRLAPRFFGKPWYKVDAPESIGQAPIHSGKRWSPMKISIILGIMGMNMIAQSAISWN